MFAQPRDKLAVAKMITIWTLLCIWFSAMYCKSIIQHEFNTFLQIRCLISRDVSSTQRQTCGCKDDHNMNSSLYLVQCNVLQKHHSTRVQHFSPNTLFKISWCSLNPETNLRLQRWSQYELFFVSGSMQCIAKASFNTSSTLFSKYAV